MKCHLYVVRALEARFAFDSHASLRSSYFSRIVELSNLIVEGS